MALQKRSSSKRATFHGLHRDLDGRWKYITPARADVCVVHCSTQRGVSSSMRGSSSPGYIFTDQLLAAAAGALVHHAQLQLLAAAGDHTAPARADVGVVHRSTPLGHTTDGTALYSGCRRKLSATPRATFPVARLKQLARDQTRAWTRLEDSKPQTQTRPTRTGSPSTCRARHAKQAADANRNAQIAAQQTAVAIGNAQQAALQAADVADWLASGYDCLHWSDARWRAARKAY
jgi:hypothetical protein